MTWLKRGLWLKCTVNSQIKWRIFYGLKKAILIPVIEPEKYYRYCKINWRFILSQNWYILGSRKLTLMPSKQHLRRDSFQNSRLAPSSFYIGVPLVLILQTTEWQKQHNGQLGGTLYLQTYMKLKRSWNRSIWTCSERRRTSSDCQRKWSWWAALFQWGCQLTTVL